jgi:hypothetical protein
MAGGIAWTASCLFLVLECYCATPSFRSGPRNRLVSSSSDKISRPAAQFSGASSCGCWAVAESVLWRAPPGHKRISRVLFAIASLIALATFGRVQPAAGYSSKPRITAACWQTAVTSLLIAAAWRQITASRWESNRTSMKLPRLTSARRIVYSAGADFSLTKRSSSR